jgi:hypothetical protein
VSLTCVNVASIVVDTVMTINRAATATRLARLPAIVWVGGSLAELLSRPHNDLGWPRACDAINADDRWRQAIPRQA